MNAPLTILYETTKPLPQLDREGMKNEWQLWAELRHWRDSEDEHYDFVLRWELQTRLPMGGATAPFDAPSGAVVVDVLSDGEAIEWAVDWVRTKTVAIHKADVAATLARWE